MQFSFSIIALAALAGFVSATAYDDCQTADNTCRTAADANMSYCASQAASCCDAAELATACEVDSPNTDELCFAPYSACYTSA